MYYLLAMYNNSLIDILNFFFLQIVIIKDSYIPWHFFCFYTCFYAPFLSTGDLSTLKLNLK